MTKYFGRPWRLIGYAVVGFVVSVVTHNMVYAVFGVEEPVFLLLAAIVSPVVLLVGVGLVLVRLMRSKNSGKLW